MGSNAPDPTGFTPPDLLAGQTTQTSPTGGIPNPVNLPSPTDLTNTLATAGTDITSLLDILSLIVPDLVDAIKNTNYSAIGHMFQVVGGFVDHAAKIVQGDFSSVWGFVSNFSPTAALFSGMINEGLGVNSLEFDTDGAAGVQTANNMLLFAFLLPLIGGAVEVIGKPILAGRWPEALNTAIERLPEEFGLSWALGTVLDRAFEAALGDTIERNIRAQKMSYEPEWPIIRQMLRQHIETPIPMSQVWANAGFNPKWAAALNALETQPLPVGDIQGAYQQGLLNASDTNLTTLGTVVDSTGQSSLDPSTVDYWLVKLGFDGEASQLIKELYITKAETAAGAELRAVYRQLFRDGKISEQDYRTELASVDFPQRLIDDDVKAIQKEQDVGWKSASLTAIKSAYLHNPGSQSTAINKLMQEGYSQTDASDLVASWTAPPIPRHRGLTEAQILKYYVAGIALNPPALVQLQALGLDAGTAQFLLDHPLSALGSHVVRLTPSLVIQAYLSGAIQQNDLKAELTKAGATSDTLDYLYQTALYRYAHHHEPGSGTNTLTDADIRDLFKLGVYDEGTAVNALMGNGWSHDNAILLLEITNKGQPLTPPAPLFPSVQAAAAYLEAMGVTVGAGTDPSFEAAVSMVEQAGYVVTFPPNFHPPTSGGVPTPLPPPPTTLP